jgi:hypothetical protein
MFASHIVCGGQNGTRWRAAKHAFRTLRVFDEIGEVGAAAGDQAEAERRFRTLYVFGEVGFERILLDTLHHGRV